MEFDVVARFPELAGIGPADTRADDRLSRIRTIWTEVFDRYECPGIPDPMQQARAHLLSRYAAAAYRYCCAMARDPGTAEEVTQRFALRFLEGKIRPPDDPTGRFRDYLKATLRNLVREYWREQGRDRPELPADLTAPEAAPADEIDREFLTGLRADLLEQAWAGLERHQQETGTPYYAVLDLKAKDPALRSAEIAKRLADGPGGLLTEPGVRKLLERARQKFADLLVEAMAQSLPPAEADRLADDLADLGLLEFCRNSVDRRHRPVGQA